ncbi:MAG TPA: ATP-binding protein, partial [Pyrinomonadaceae bacterium]|nr:ATP-binding protein [Pyrinomonadaceae bacterium]
QRLVIIKNLALLYLHTKDKRHESQIEGISNEASQALNEVKGISYNLRPYQLDRIGLTKAIEAIIRSAESASEINFSAKIDDIDGYFPKESEINFYRIVQESVNNILKHSNATKAKVEIKSEEQNLKVIIDDNGVGFSPETKSNGFGLIGIKERVDLLNGNIEIITALNQGVIIKILIQK